MPHLTRRRSHQPDGEDTTIQPRPAAVVLVQPADVLATGASQ